MVKGEGRIVAALAAVFVALGGISAALRGLLFDQTAMTYYGVLAVFIAAATFVVMLTPMPGDEP
jgi:peptidoglycan/LPS O-acetylase OafA/YrhL